MKTKNIFQDIFLKPLQRKGLSYNNTSITMPVYFYRTIGINNVEEDQYYNNLFNLDMQLSKLGVFYKKIDNGLGTAIPPRIIEQINNKWQLAGEFNIDDLKHYVERLYNLGLVPLFKNSPQNTLIKENVLRILDLFLSNQKIVNSSILKNFFVKLIYWIEQFGLENIINFDYGNYNPKILFYGDIKRDEIYFLIFLSMTGYDIVYFNPLSDGSFSEIDKKEIYSNKIEFAIKLPIKSFPLVEKLKRAETIGYQVSREVESLTNSETSGFYKPWQFINHNVKPSPLRSIYEELFSLWKEPSNFRTGFDVKDNAIYVPNIFAKINGTNLNLNVYWTNVLKLLKDNKDNIIFINQIPFTKGVNLKPFNFKDLMKSNGLFDDKKVFRWKDYNLSYLRTPVQTLIIEKINELIVSDHIFLQSISQDFKIKILLTVLNLDKKYYDLIQRFDYPFAIPKLIIYDNNETIFSEEDFITLGFLNSIGFDIVILTPPGYNNIENGINKDLFDIHYLEELRFNLPLSREVKSEIQKINKTGFMKGWFER